MKNLPIAKEQKGKPQLGLLFRSFLEATARARAYGLTKYEANSFRRASKLDILSACLRHIFADLDNEEIDEDSKLPHLALAASNLMLEIEKRHGETPKI